MPGLPHFQKRVSRTMPAPARRNPVQGGDPQRASGAVAKKEKEREASRMRREKSENLPVPSRRGRGLAGH